MICDQYFNRILALEKELYEQERDRVREAARLIAAVVAHGGLVHMFGCGHSHMLAEEAFYRAGGLAAVDPIMDSAVMLHEGAVKSSAVERMSGYAEPILDRFDARAGDVLVVFSTSGLNALPVDMALYAKQKGLHVIAVTSAAYRDAPSRHPQGKRLADVGDIVIDNHVPLGDALVTPEGMGHAIAPASTVLGALLVNMIVAQVAEELRALGVEPPYFKSGNLPGGAEYNRRYVELFRSRVRML